MNFLAVVPDCVVVTVDAVGVTATVETAEVADVTGHTWPVTVLKRYPAMQPVAGATVVFVVTGVVVTGATV